MRLYFPDELVGFAERHPGFANLLLFKEVIHDIHGPGFVCDNDNDEDAGDDYFYVRFHSFINDYERKLGKSRPHLFNVCVLNRFMAWLPARPENELIEMLRNNYERYI